MSKRKKMNDVVQGFSSNPMDKALYDDSETEETDALFKALSNAKRGGRTAIVPTDGNGELAFNGWTLSPQGLIAPETVTESDYEQIGRVLLRLDSSMQWLIGDWINTGDNFQWGETYQRVADDFGYTEKTLREYAYVARSVEMSIRYGQLSFGHHQTVASMSAKDQRYWLSKAADEGLSISKMRAAIKESQLPPPPKSTEPLIGLVNRVKIAAGRFDNGAGHRGVSIARDLYQAGLWDGEGEIWFYNIYEIHPDVELGKIDLASLRIEREPDGVHVSLPDDIDRINAKMPPGTSVEHIGTYNASEMGRMYADLTEALKPGDVVKTRVGHFGTVESVDGKQAKVRTGSYTTPHDVTSLEPVETIDEDATFSQPEAPQTDGFSHKAYRKHQDMWADARRAFEDVRSIDAARFTSKGKLGRSHRNRAINTIRDLIAHLHYIESQLQD